MTGPVDASGEPAKCDCGQPLAGCCVDCAVADYQASNPTCATCCPIRPAAAAVPSPPAQEHFCVLCHYRWTGEGVSEHCGNCHRMFLEDRAALQPSSPVADPQILPILKCTCVPVTAAGVMVRSPRCPAHGDPSVTFTVAAEPPASHPWTTTTDKNKCDICGDGPWGRHRFQEPR